MSHILVTDHALIRYIERRHGIDLQDIRDQLRDEVRAAVKAGAASFFDGQVTYMLDGTKVITVMDGHVRNRPDRATRSLVEA